MPTRPRSRTLGFRLLSDKEFANARRFQSYDDFENLELHSTILIDAQGRVHWARNGGDPFADFDFLIKEITRLNQRRASHHHAGRHRRGEGNARPELSVRARAQSVRKHFDGEGVTEAFTGSASRVDRGRAAEAARPPLAGSGGRRWRPRSGWLRWRSRTPERGFPSRPRAPPPASRPHRPPPARGQRRTGNHDGGVLSCSRSSSARRRPVSRQLVEEGRLQRIEAAEARDWDFRGGCRE